MLQQEDHLHLQQEVTKKFNIREYLVLQKLAPLGTVRVTHVFGSDLREILCVGRWEG